MKRQQQAKPFIRTTNGIQAGFPKLYSNTNFMIFHHFPLSFLCILRRVCSQWLFVSRYAIIYDEKCDGHCKLVDYPLIQKVTFSNICFPTNQLSTATEIFSKIYFPSNQPSCITIPKNKCYSSSVQEVELKYLIKRTWTRNIDWIQFAKLFPLLKNLSFFRTGLCLNIMLQSEIMLTLFMNLNKLCLHSVRIPMDGTLYAKKIQMTDVTIENCTIKIAKSNTHLYLAHVGFNRTDNATLFSPFVKALFIDGDSLLRAPENFFVVMPHCEEVIFGDAYYTLLAEQKMINQICPNVKTILIEISCDYFPSLLCFKHRQLIKELPFLESIRLINYRGKDILSQQYLEQYASALHPITLSYMQREEFEEKLLDYTK